ncbi:MAG: hypothetical protein AB7U79_01970 [Candidatus Izemoplasmatales bacterium]
MKKYIRLWRLNLDQFSLTELIYAFLGSMVLSTLIIAPIVIMAIETLVVYFYLLYTFTVLFFVIAVLYFYLIYRFYLRALTLMKNDVSDFSSIKKLAWYHFVGFCLFGLIVTTLFIVWWIPLLLV